MRVRVHHTVDRLATKYEAVPARAAEDLARCVRTNAKDGRDIARAFARDTSGAHARYYPGLINVEMHTPMEWEYGPDPRGQGLLAPILENGSINNPPHLNLARSADAIGPEFARDVRKLAAKWLS